MAFALRCPDCRKTFRWKPELEFPDECPLCHAKMPEDKTDDDNVIVMPAFLSAKTKQNDQLYRQIESSSEERVHKAAEMAGCDAADMASLKVTNLNPTRHPGDIAAVPVVNPVSQHMDAMQQRGMPVGFGGGANAQELAANAHTGSYPRAGAAAAEKTQRMLHGMK